MYHGSKSKSHQWGSWSDWVLDENHHRYYRFRQDSEGNYDYDWDQHDSAAAAHAQTPRDTTINDITEGLKGLTTDYDGSISEDHLSNSKSGRPKSKHRHRTGSHDEDSAQGAYRTSTAESLHVSQAGQYDYMASQYVHGSSEAQYYQPSTSGSQSAPVYGAREDRSAENHAADRDRPLHGYDERNHYDERKHSPDQDHEDDELANTIAESQDYNAYAYANAGESSASAYAQYDDDEDEGPPTPKAQSGAGSYHIAALEEPLEELDPRYRVEPSSKFQPGEIFKVHWSEPQGASFEGAPSVSGKHEIQNRFGTKFFVGFRRFIVIANDQGHCTCVPILTYGGKACKKKGVKADKHGIIHERGSKPRLLDKEPKLGFPPVRVEMKEEGEKLSKESRVNYSKLVTVEHNVKVFFIGSIVYNDWELVSDAVNHCWNKKNHQKQRHR
ncbi:hypothetical protein TsFJ059_005948 [Trichoderma semiorbis]|uniref:DUF6590 domain-containing protein n=1 Tax=Trichoderma semiorbis TaxID=1491008 RepID=A0A9P8HBY8_9HYPO|nr:hypothetical protein TsFJ059_005948 [Trichoderma semiorbis]